MHDHDTAMDHRNKAVDLSQKRLDDGSSSSSDCGDSPSFCSVCQEDISSQVQQVHYGAKACFSCRAFFRRSVAQGSYASKFRCICGDRRTKRTPKTCR